MADPALQLLLDPEPRTGNGIRILRRVNAGTLTSYYVHPNVGPYAGRARWINVTEADTDAQKNTAIRLALSKP